MTDCPVCGQPAIFRGDLEGSCMRMSLNDEILLDIHFKCYVDTIKWVAEMIRESADGYELIRRKVRK